MHSSEIKTLNMLRWMGFDFVRITFGQHDEQKKQIFQSPNYHIKFGVLNPIPVETMKGLALSINCMNMKVSIVPRFQIYKSKNHILFEQSNETANACIIRIKRIQTPY